MKIGIRELCDGLSSGHIITVTDRGRPVARIVPVDAPTALERLVAEGRVCPSSKPKRPSPEPVAATGPVSDLIDVQRR